MSKKILQRMGFLILLGIPLLGFATSAGEMASGLLGPVNIVANFISSISITIGIAFIFASIIKYMQYRVNPLAVPLSTPVFLLIMGIILVCLPLTYKLTKSGVVIHF